VSTLPEGYKELSPTPRNDEVVNTCTLWGGSWRYGTATYRDGQYYNKKGGMIDTPSGWMSND